MSARVNSAEKQGTIPTDTSQGRPLEKGSPALENAPSMHALPNQGVADINSINLAA